MGNRTSTPRGSDIELQTLTGNIDQESGLETNYDGLSDYLERLYNEELCFKRSPFEVMDIEDAVQEMVGRILDEVGNIDPRFTCSTRHFVGSMAEGTRIIEPDEFDFLVVIDELSFNDAVTWSIPGHYSLYKKTKGSVVHITIEQSHNGNAWRDMSTNQTLKSTSSYIIDKGIKQCFLKVVRKAVAAVVERGDTIVKTTGSLIISSSRVEQNGVACTLSDSFLWSSKETQSACSTELPISVDITAAIQTTFEKSGIERSDVADDWLYERLKDTNVVTVLPCENAECISNKCFKYSVTTLELEKMKTKMRDHVKCYMVLKYLLCGTCKCKLPCLHLPDTKHSHSYTVKNLMFKHVESCSNRTLGSCVLDILCGEPNHILDTPMIKDSDYSVKLIENFELDGYIMKYFDFLYNEAAKQRITQKLNNISDANTSIANEGRFPNFTPIVDLLPRMSTLKRYQFPLVFILHILHWLSLYSYSCLWVVVFSWRPWFSSWSPPLWQTLLVTVSIQSLVMLAVLYLHSFDKRSMQFPIAMIYLTIFFAATILVRILYSLLGQPEWLMFLINAVVLVHGATFLHMLSMTMLYLLWPWLRPRLPPGARLVPWGLLMALFWSLIVLIPTLVKIIVAFVVIIVSIVGFLYDTLKRGHNPLCVDRACGLRQKTQQTLENARRTHDHRTFFKKRRPDADCAQHF